MPGAAFALARIPRFMPHAYTWQKMTSATTTPTPANEEDEAYGLPDVSLADPVPNRPCLWRGTTREVDDATGQMVVTTPTLWVPADDPIDENDWVTDITDRKSGVVLEPGPLRVDAGGALEVAPTGPVILKVVSLVSATEAS